jgi:hypothetical protein
MRRVFPAAVLMTVALLLPVPVAAQDPSPPAIGSAVTFVDAEGVERGVITIEELADPFEEFNPGSPPAEGMRYVLLTMSFDATTDQTFDADPQDVVVRDASGILYYRGSVPRPPEVLVPELQSQSLAPGNRISGVIGYVLPADAAIDDILYQPETYRFVPLADLTPGEGPAAGIPISWVDANGATATITVNLTDPFEEYEPNYPPAEGMRFVVVHAVVENTGDAQFNADPSWFYLRVANGAMFQRGTITRAADTPIPDFQAQTLAPGDRISGVLPYVIPVDAQIIGVDFWPEWTRLSTILDPQASGPGPAPTEAPASVAP